MDTEGWERKELRLVDSKQGFVDTETYLSACPADSSAANIRLNGQALEFL